MRIVSAQVRLDETRGDHVRSFSRNACRLE